MSCRAVEFMGTVVNKQPVSAVGQLDDFLSSGPFVPVYVLYSVASHEDGDIAHILLIYRVGEVATDADTPR